MIHLPYIRLVPANCFSLIHPCAPPQPSSLVHRVAPGSRGDVPLFCYPYSLGLKALSYTGFLSLLKSFLTRLGVDPTRYAGHSFWRGGASLALAGHLPPELIKLQGDWRSDCYQRYLDPDLRTKFSAARTLAREVQSHQHAWSMIWVAYLWYVNHCYQFIQRILSCLLTYILGFGCFGSRGYTKHLADELLRKELN